MDPLATLLGFGHKLVGLRVVHLHKNKYDVGFESDDMMMLMLMLMVTFARALFEKLTGV